MHELNANAALPGAPVHLATGLSNSAAVLVDGPANFALRVTIIEPGSTSATLQPIDGQDEPAGRAKTLKPGESAIVDRRTLITTTGETFLRVERTTDPVHDWRRAA